MATANKLSDVVPNGLVSIIRDRIKAGVSDAEAKFELHEEEEDSVTGALAQTISTAGSLLFTSPEGKFSYQIKSKKIRGRGPGAPEKRLGADALFQVTVYFGRELVFGKGLPIQAKIRGGFENEDVRIQARHLLHTADAGIILRYSENGYTARDIHDLFMDDAERSIPSREKPRKLATILGDDFLDCRTGRKDLFYQPSKAPPKYIDAERGAWVISTDIRALTLRGIIAPPIN